MILGVSDSENPIPKGTPNLTPDDDMFTHLAISYVKNVKEIPEEPEPNGPSVTAMHCPAIAKTFDNGIVNGARWGAASGSQIFNALLTASCCRNKK